MNRQLGRSWLDRLLAMAISLAAVGLLLNWAWQLIRPLIPVMVVTVGLGVIVTFIIQRRRSW
ncbi:MAG: hypothetical protein M3021_09785 [Actinomycetota bacterium]|nr:hypothetical protein [Actinomycetota bacterium]